MKKQYQLNWLTFILHIFGFLLLWEWIRPLEKIADTGDTHVFILFIGAGLLLFYLRIHWAVHLFISVIYILYTIYVLFPIQGVFSFWDWFPFYREDVFYNIKLIFQADWQAMSNPFRTTLFFIVLWLMIYLIHYWLVTRKRIFLFIFFTLIYITVLDTFSPYDAKGAIVRTVVIGFLTVGLLYFSRLLDREGISHKGRVFNKWAFSLALMVGFSTLVAIAAPKASPIWPDPVPYLEAYYKRGEDPGGLRKSGYSMDDSQLGGPYIADNTLVFQAEVDDTHYWRIETKDVYTGKGWIAAQPSSTIPFEGLDPVPLSIFPEESRGENERTAQIQFAQTFTQLVYPSGIKQVIDTNPNASFVLDPSVERITPLRNGNPTPITSAEYTYHMPLYSLSGMKAAQNTGGLSPDFVARYTQLPEALPSRVVDLAEEITADKTNWYDKAAAIRDYLRSGSYTYDQLNVAIPGEDDDYVDQFLFETFRGYCDNFSTSMVVLLRAADIPARWVKGFTEGTVSDYQSDGRIVYDIQNNNAHSWVEVYFPEVGWVPFEPTPGFSNNVTIDYDLETNLDDTETPELPETEKPETPTPEEEDQSSAGGGNGLTLSEIWDNIKTFVAAHVFWFIGGFIIAALIGLYLYKIRAKWLPRILFLRYRNKNDASSFMDSYVSLLRQFKRYGIKLEDGQTLRTYAKYIDSFFSTNDMSKITMVYESFVYGQNQEADFKELMKCWENLMKKTMA
ncbi:transglutaminase superfamily protein [Bacillus oleivorans]|uniref:Transglutaminase superfamily protein n=1 Tax=Bacillus oleivorans TaxID=1448271 RepID=A0A285D7P5_9BACI|nr:transglutaminaseTgpA domain-containing protein [Bacillus oleivorans]SNX75832.1 transglutaminase superfamily protein [Bacillus oleivorans]